MVSARRPAALAPLLLVPVACACWGPAAAGVPLPSPVPLPLPPVGTDVLTSSGPGSGCFREGSHLTFKGAFSNHPLAAPAPDLGVPLPLSPVQLLVQSQPGHGHHDKAEADDGRTGNGTGHKQDGGERGNGTGHKQDGGERGNGTGHKGDGATQTAVEGQTDFKGDYAIVYPPDGSPGFPVGRYRATAVAQAPDGRTAQAPVLAIAIQAPVFSNASFSIASISAARWNGNVDVYVEVQGNATASLCGHASGELIEGSMSLQTADSCWPDADAPCTHQPATLTRGIFLLPGSGTQYLGVAGPFSYPAGAGSGPSCATVQANGALDVPPASFPLGDTQAVCG